MAVHKLPVEEFIEFHTLPNKRRDEIIDRMAYLKSLFDDADDWKRACFHKIPLSLKEVLYVSYAIGNTEGIQAAEAVLSKN